MTDQQPPFPEVEPPSRSILRNLSLVWLVPILALAVALGIAWQAYSERGTLIEIRFENAAGVAAGDTTIRYRDVVIGEVEDVHFTPDLQAVIVAARVDTEVLPFLDEDATFWVVRPEISSQGVSGLSTVVSGVYIEGAWDNDAGTTQYEFEGRADPLFVLPGEEGRRLTLSVPVGVQLSGGAPVSYRGITVGRLEEPTLSEDGLDLSVDVFIEAPHDQRISEATRFWDTSGFSINLGAQGLSLDVESLASLVTGGIEFDEVYVGGEPVGENAEFDVYLNEELARASAFTAGPVGDVPLSVHFTRIIRGLVPGTRVVMDDTTIGGVTAVEVRRIETPAGPQQRMVADLVVDAARIGLDAGATTDEVYAFFAEEVGNGLRARLASAGLIAGETRIEFAIDYADEDVVMDVAALPYPVIPWVPAAASSLNTTAEGVLARVAGLPFERLLDQAIDTMASIEGLAGDPALRGISEEAISLLEDARETFTGEAVQSVPAEALAFLEEARALLAGEAVQGVPTDARAALADIRALIAGETVQAVPTEALAILTDIRTMIAGDEVQAVPTEALAILADIRALIAGDDVQSVPTEALAALADVRALIADEDLQAVPDEARGALTDLRAILTEFSESDISGSITSLITQAEGTLTPINAATARLPEIMENLTTLSETAAALELEATLTAANTVLAAVDGFLSAEGMDQVPANLASALAELENLTSALGEADVVGSLDATLDAANAAALELPGLVARTETVLTQVTSLLTSYGARSDFMGNTMAVLDEITSAARAISRLARTIERNPSSLLTGR